MEERGFDQLQNGMWPALLLVGTVVLVGIIFAGGILMMRMERQWKETHLPDGTPREDV